MVLQSSKTNPFEGIETTMCPAPQGDIRVYDPAIHFEGMRHAGQLAAKVLDFITPYVRVGALTADLDARMEAFILDHGAIPAPKGYRGFPKATCISLNEVVCHGIPGALIFDNEKPPRDRPLKANDCLNIDVTVILDGWYGDTSRMFLAGDKVPARTRKLINTTHRALMAGISKVKPGASLYHIAMAIQTIAHKDGFGVIQDFCGHGLGRVFHEHPNVMHYVERNAMRLAAQKKTILHPGMLFTIEPMINGGSWESKILKDSWTAVTVDRQPSAQFEHTIGVTETGYEIFTLSPSGLHKPPYTQ